MVVNIAIPLSKSTICSKQSIFTRRKEGKNDILKMDMGKGLLLMYFSVKKY